VTIASLLRQELSGNYRPLLAMGAFIALSNLVLLVIVHHIVATPVDTLFHLFILYLAALLFWAIGSHYFQRLIVDYVAKSMAIIRLRLLDELQRLSLRAYESEVPREEVYTALEYDVESIALALNAITRMLNATVIILSCLIYLLIVSPQIFVFTLAMILVGLTIYGYLQQLRSEAIRHMRGAENHLFASLFDLLRGFRELKLDPRREADFYANRFQASLNEARDWRIVNARLLVHQQLLAMSTWTLLFLGLLLFLPLHDAIAAEVALKSVGIILFMPWDVLLDGINRAEQARISLIKLVEFERHLKSLPQEPAPDEQNQSGSPPPRTTLRGERILFSYHDANHEPSFTLGPLDIELRIGGIHFVSGPNGSGKTTLMKLLAGLYPAAQGRILADDVTIPALALRQHFSIVFADAHIFDRLYGLEGNSEQDLDTRVQDWLQRMQLTDKTGYRNGCFTEIRLSTGQRKRLALAVALLWERPLLIFDEWTCEQDPHFRGFFYRELLPLLRKQGKTIIAVTHDEEYFDLADVHYRLEDGQLCLMNGDRQGGITNDPHPERAS
jgi:putative pyoverdin transport system ATP-binding/permease protein